MKKQNIITASIIGATALLAAGSVLYFKSRKTEPEGAQVVKPFSVKKYLGKWHEIARLDFHFEKNLNNVTAEYSLNEDGSIKVVNRGHNYKTNKIEESVGKAKFAGDFDEGKLKVSFFGPIYASYNVIAIDKSYRYALVAGRNLNYMWLLSRETSMPEDIKQDYLQKAKALGYKTENLVWSEN